MRLMINGNETQLKGSLSVSALLKHLDIDPARVAVEVNLNVIKRNDYQSVALQDGDNIEIVNFVGGG